MRARACLTHRMLPSAPVVKTLVLVDAMSRMSPVKSLTLRVSLGVEKVQSHCLRKLQPQLRATQHRAGAAGQQLACGRARQRVRCSAGRLPPSLFPSAPQKRCAYEHARGVGLLNDSTAKGQWSPLTRHKARPVPCTAPAQPACLRAHACMRGCRGACVPEEPLAADGERAHPAGVPVQLHLRMRTDQSQAAFTRMHPFSAIFSVEGFPTMQAGLP